MKDYYKILGVDPYADQEVIRSAYRVLSKKYHPDVNKDPNAESIFKEITEAYEIIGDVNKRNQYNSKYFNNIDQEITTVKINKDRVIIEEDQTIKNVFKGISNFIFGIFSQCIGIIFLGILLSIFSWICKTGKSDDKKKETTNDNSTQVVTQNTATNESKEEDLEFWEAVDIKTGSTPNCFKFKSKFDKSIDNKLEISVGIHSDVVIKLINVSTNKCIRYVFIKAGDTYAMRNIPEGVYITKIAYGQEWRQKIINNGCIGKFIHKPLYKKGDDKLDFRLIHNKNGYQIPFYKLTLDVVNLEKDDKRYDTDYISEEYFNE